MNLLDTRTQIKLVTQGYINEIETCNASDRGTLAHVMSNRQGALIIISVD